MARAHDLPEAIQWHEGMLLGPQHLQQQSLRSEALLHYHSVLISPFHWGVRHLKIDPALLLDGQFRVLELEVVMPDGLVVSSVQQDLSGLAVDLAPFKEGMADEPATVHLAVPGRRGRGAPVKGELARYDSVEGEPITDENTGEGEVRIPRLRPRVSLIVGETPPEKYVSFPLARIAYANETFEQADFVPPILRVRPHSPLSDLCAAVAARLREKAIYLAEKARAPSVAARPPQLLETKGRAHALVAGLPQLEALLSSGVAHPFTLYLSLCSLVGHVATLSTSLMPPVLEPYDHDNLHATFARARAFLDRVITEGFIESFDGYPFVLEEGRFALRFDPAWQGRRLILGVRARSGRGEAETADWLEHSLIGSQRRIPEMRQKRVLGARRKAVEGEADLVPTQGVRLFALTPEPDATDFDETVVIFNPDDPDGRRRPAEIVLYVKKAG